MTDQRTKRREWKNGKYPHWTTHITWYDDNAGPENELGGDIRLFLTDSERSINVYPKDLESAEKVWFMFKQGSPVAGDKTPFIAGLLDLLKSQNLFK